MLLKDDGHVRPVPPENLYDEVVFEEGLVVDADHKDRWCTGVLLKQMEDDDDEKQRFLVYFDSPPDIVLFEKKKLRPHFDWTGLKWVRPKIKELDKSMFSSGKMVEVSSATDKFEVVWFPAMLIKEIQVNGEKKFVVKEDYNKRLRCNGDESRPNTTVVARRVRPTPPPFSCKEYSLLDPVEAFRGGSGWRRGFVRGILADKSYMVSLEATKEEYVFKHSALRPLMVWKDGVWHDESERGPVEKTPSKVIEKKPTRTKPMTPKILTKYGRRSLNPEENGDTLTKAEAIAATGELRKKRTDDVMIDKTHPVITKQVTSIEKESISPVTEAETEGKQSLEIEAVKNQNGFGNDSTPQKMPREESSKDTSRKRRREEEHNSYLKETDETCTGSRAEINGTSKNVCVDDDQALSAWRGNLSTELSSDQSTNVVYNAAAATDVDETPAKDTLTSLPFAKKSPFWKKYETNEDYKIVPQSPHFSPLAKAEEDFREWTAVGMMVSFYGLLEEVKDLQLDVSSSKLSSLSSLFAKLEKFGFDVAMPQARIEKVLSIQDERAKKMEARKCLEDKIEAEKRGKQKMKEEMAELERRIMELKQNTEAAEKRIVEMESSAGTTDQEIKDLVLEFHTTVSSPW